MKLWRKPFDQAEKSTIPGHILIDKERCKGCGYCVEYCPKKVLKTSEESNSKGYLMVEVADETKCLACCFCEVICPEFAIKVLASTND